MQTLERMSALVEEAAAEGEGRVQVLAAAVVPVVVAAAQGAIWQSVLAGSGQVVLVELDARCFLRQVALVWLWAGMASLLVAGDVLR